jgi:1,4-dihydroxy-2-naphthoate octaprenyltransferase
LSYGRPSKARAFFAEMRAPFLTGAIVPVILGTCVAWALNGVFFLDVFLLTLIAGMSIHVGANVANDYFDHRSGTDDINIEYVRPFTGGSRMIQRGWLSPREVFAESMMFFALGSGIGLYLAFTRGIEILIIGVIGVGSGFFYTAPPFRLVNRGIGEVFIGLNFGVLMTLGSYFVQAQILSWDAIFPSIPIAILITAVLFINEFPDYDADKAVGKLTAVVRLGRERASKGYVILMISLYLSILIPVVLGLVDWYTLLGLATIPAAILACRYALHYHDLSLPLIPAYASTITNHLFTGLFLSLSYLLIGLSSPPSYVAVSAAICLGFMLAFYYMTERKARVAASPAR